MKLRWVAALAAIACLCVITCFAPAAQAQQDRGSGAPSGTCPGSSGALAYLDTTNHIVYVCSNGTWINAGALPNPTGGGGGGGITSPNSLPRSMFYVASTCPANTPTCFAINNDFVLDWTCSWTAGGTITCTDAPFTPGNSNGKRVLSTTLAETGFTSFGTSVKQCTGTLTYISSTQATASGTCLGGASGPLWFGTPDTTQMVAWSTAITNACAGGTLPGVNAQGTGPSIIAISKGLWTSAPQVCQGTVAANRSGVTITGQGTSTSYILMLDDFDPTTCVPGCFGYPTATQSSDGGLSLQNFTITGGGNSAPGAGFNGKDLVLLTANSYVQNFFGLGFGAAQAGLVGVAWGSGNSFGPLSGSNFSIDGFGRNNCLVNNATFITWTDNSFCGDSAGESVTVSAGGSLVSTGNIFGPSTSGSTCEVDVNGSGAYMRSIGDQVNSSASAASSVSYCIQTGTLDLSHAAATKTSATSFGIKVLGVASFIHLNDTVVSGTSGAIQLNTGGTVYDEGGNKLTGGVSLVSGSYLGEANSANQITITAAKTVLSAGWGSTAAVTALSGGNAPVQFTITNSGTGQGASPTITYTFPTAYPVAPYSCTATQVGGTNATGTFTSSALSATGVTFTFSLTPTAASTEIVQVTCVTP